jgi:hypothetical protein
MCTAQDQCHNAGTCNPTTGTCSYTEKPNGTGCNDGNNCDQASCQNGACMGTPKVCPQGYACNPSNGQCACVPKTCAEVGSDCGNPPDGCGGTLNCGNTCPYNQTCGAVTNYQCPKCHDGPLVQFNSGQVSGCGLPKQPGQCNTNYCWVVSASCDIGHAVGVANVNISGTCSGQPMAAGPTDVTETGGIATAYFDKESDQCYFSGCESALNISFNPICCLP